MLKFDLKKYKLIILLKEILKKYRLKLYNIENK